MEEIIRLTEKTELILSPKSPYNFDANLHKPSHFPSSDNFWEKGFYWISMLWKNQVLGLKFENLGTISKPKIKTNVYSQKELSKDFIESLIPEIGWRFNFDQDVSEFCNKYKKDKFLEKFIQKWKGMKPISGNSLYEMLIIFFVLQNATVRRSVQMLENLFQKFGQKVCFDGKTLSTFWDPDRMAKSSEQELRDLKVGYRTKFFIRLTQQFVNNELNDFELRKMNKEQIKEEVLKIYGVGPASAEYLLFEYFYFLDSLEIIPPWEQKIMSKLLFNKKIVSTKEILDFFKKRYKGYEKLAFHYIWEDIFWQRKNKTIPWLEKEIRL